VARLIRGEPQRAVALVKIGDPTRGHSPQDRSDERIVGGVSNRQVESMTGRHPLPCGPVAGRVNGHRSPQAHEPFARVADRIHGGDDRLGGLLFPALQRRAQQRVAVREVPSARSP